MTEKHYPTQEDAQLPQQPNKRMVIDEDGSFVMQSITSEEPEALQLEVSTEPEVMQSAEYVEESPARDTFEGEESVIQDDIQSPIYEPAASNGRKKLNKKSSHEKNGREKRPLSVMDRLYRGVGMVAIAGLGWTGIAGVSNYAASKVRYGVDIGYRQQLDNATKLPDEIDRRIEQAKRAVDVINFFNIKEVTGGSND